MSRRGCHVGGSLLFRWYVLIENRVGTWMKIQILRSLKLLGRLK